MGDNYYVGHWFVLVFHVSMENPFKNIELKFWPDFLLAISGLAFVVSVAAMYSGATLARSLSVGFFGLVLFGIGGKISHHRFRDPNIRENSNAWFSGWRHSMLANLFAAIGVIIVLLSVWLISKPNA
ncbi:hypothetical protein [Arhodomonas sp. SL1]|uniref:hypothetical protein n=1 Tax=Arhodomonas sp. SL1 TaxID=3425691 RepID=UPI003F885C24